MKYLLLFLLLLVTPVRAANTSPQSPQLTVAPSQNIEATPTLEPISTPTPSPTATATVSRTRVIKTPTSTVEPQFVPKTEEQINQEEAVAKQQTCDLAKKQALEAGYQIVSCDPLKISQ